MTRTNGQHGEAMPSPSSCREMRSGSSMSTRLLQRSSIAFARSRSVSVLRPSSASDDLYGIGQLGEVVSIRQGALSPIVVLFVPVLSFLTGDALGERLDSRISPRTWVVVERGLDRPERRQGGDVAHH